ncbi:MAG: Mpo1-like protein [Rehaibacterium terrae]|uniref:Mpo1-like protein n=1 Tax=Rehaibacterium terrae TaxID=1341696 RepID=UPI00391C0925
MSQRYASFREFYPYYLSEHSDRTCRRLHFIGSASVLGVLGAVIAGALSPWWLLSLPLIGYGFAWVGHFFFEKNRPATFTYPLYSLIGDWVMFKDMLIGRIRF